MSLLEFDKVSYSYPGHGRAIDGVSLAIEPGEFVCVLGANGSGKSTLAQLVNGLIVPGEGRVRTCGHDTADAARLGAIRSQVGLVFQNPDDQIVASLVEDDVAFGPGNLALSPDELRTRVDEALGKVGLDGFQRRDVSTLSGGEKQRVAIAGALAMKPALLVLDEADSMLDPRGRDALVNICRSANREGIAVIFITHFAQTARHAKRTIVLDRGRVALDGASEDVLARTDELASLGVLAPLDDLARPEARTGLRPSEALMRFQGVSFAYPKAPQGQPPALENVDLSLHAGEILGIAGHTGSGKSTLIQLAATLLAPTSGRILYRGRPLEGKRATREARDEIGIVFQYPERQLFAATVFDDVAFGPRNAGLDRDATAACVRQALRLVNLDLDALRDVSPFALSGGEQRLVAIAGTLALEPRVLLLDEPTAGLDARARHALAELVLKLNGEGITLVIASHDQDFLGCVANRTLNLVPRAVPPAS